jgi:hypothetical protein
MTPPEDCSSSQLHGVLNNAPGAVAVFDKQSVGLTPGHAEQPAARLAGAAALLAGAGIHLVLVPGHALSVLYSLFIASAAGMVAGALLLALAPRLGWLIGGGTAFLTFLGYILSRTTGLPGVLTAIGAWFYPLGIPSLIVEGIAFCLAVWALVTA